MLRKCGSQTMTHYHEWLIENKVVYVKFWGDISVEEIGVAFAKSNDLALASATPPVHYLHNWGEVTSFPRKLHELRRLTKNVKGDSRRIGWVVVFGTENMLMRFIADVFFQMFRVRFRMFLKSEDAIDFIKRIDTTVPDFPELPEIPHDYVAPQVDVVTSEPEATQTAEAAKVVDETRTTEAAIVSARNEDAGLTETEPPSKPDDLLLVETDPPSDTRTVEPLETDEDETVPVETLSPDEKSTPLETLKAMNKSETIETESVEASTNSDD